MGEVYRAKDPRLGREVAIKVLPASFSQDADRLRRFEQEARAAGVLNHPNITAVHDIGTHDGTLYVVSELLEGETLRARLAGGPLPARKATDYALQIAHGLAAAHEKGIVHRDLKPENLFVTKDGRIKILDFGLAKLTHPQKPGVSVTEFPTQTAGTQPGIVMGTVGYMSPEQVRGLAVDARSDIFAFGAILYEMLSGQRAFHGNTSADTMSAILMGEPPQLSAASPDVPPGLGRVVQHCLEKSPELRFQSARDVAFGLESLSDAAVTSRARDAAPVAPARRARRIRLVAAGAGLVALAAAVVIFRSRTAGGPIDSIAVLPFVNGSRDPNTEYLSDGITESVINSLSRLSQLRVAARSTVFRYKGRDPEAQQVGRDLKVRAVVSGQVVPRGDTLVVQADLVDAGNGSQLWGEHYDRRLSDILSVQEEIARDISEKLRLRLTGEDKEKLRKRYTANTDAYQLYLKGRYAWEKRSESELERSIQFFQKAIEKDPGFALGYAGLADSYAVLSSYSIRSSSESYPKVRAAARKALEIDDGLAAPHAALGLVHTNYELDWSSAESEYRKAIELDPKYATAHHWYALLLMALGRFDEAQVEILGAAEIDPFSAIIQANTCRLFVYSRQYDRAIEEGRKAVERDPDFAVAHHFLAYAYGAKKMTREAAAEFEKAASLFGQNALGLSNLGRAQALAGRRSDALATIEELKAMGRSRYVAPSYIAQVYVSLGDKDLALDLWSKALEDPEIELTLIKVDPANDFLRDDPRFSELLRRAHLAP